MTASFFLVLSLALTAASAQLSTNGAKMAMKIYDQCAQSSDMFKCLKVQALRVADRALRSKSFSLMSGVNVVSDASARSFSESYPLNTEKLDTLNNGQLDILLLKTMARFLDSHRLQVNVPQLVEEGRGKDKKGGMMGYLLALMAIKGSFLAMAYKGIAAMAGTALIVGKIALVLSALLGLKKLLSTGNEKTTFEIVKIPQHTESHAYSSSYEDEGHYHRSLQGLNDMQMQQRAYRGYKYNQS